MFSVIIPVYNVEKYLRRCLDSVLGQTYRDLEVILVNDGSTDHSLEICEEYAKKDRRIVLISKENGGLHSARNAGLDRAGGEYIWFVDSDDYVAPELAGRVLPYMETCDFCGFGRLIEYENEERKKYWCPGRHEQVYCLESETAKRTFFHREFFYCEIGWEVWARVYRRDIIEKHHLRFWDTKEVFAEDLGFTYQYILHIKKFIILPDVFYFYQVRGGSLMSTADRNSIIPRYNTLLSRLEEYAKDIGEKEIAEEFYMDAVNLISSLYRKTEREQGLGEARKEAAFLMHEPYLTECVRRFVKNKNQVYAQLGQVRGRSIMQMMLWLQNGNLREYKRRGCVIKLLNRLEKFKRYRKYTGALLLAVMLLDTAVVADAQDHPANPLEKQGYRLDFHDEFEETVLDKEKWTDLYLPQWSQDEERTRGNYRFESGCLVQYVDEEQEPWNPKLDGAIVSSAIMSFDKSWIHNFADTVENVDRETWYGYVTQYGYFEIRAKFADCGGGGHQAWWMVGMQQDTDDWYHSEESGEIDIIENFFTDQNVWRTCAYGWSDPDFQTSWYQEQYGTGENVLTEEFHTYAMEWTPTCLKFYFDNELVRIIEGSPDYEMGTILNIYGNTGTVPTNDIWPKEWYIDYYRVWKPEDDYAVSESDLFLIKNKENGGYLYMDGESSAVDCRELKGADPENMLWSISQDDRGYYYICNAATGAYLSLSDEENGQASGSRLPLYGWNIRESAAGSMLVYEQETGSSILSAGNTGEGRQKVSGSQSAGNSRWELVNCY